MPDIPGKHLAITSNEAFFLESLPGEIVIVGGGYVAIEFAGIFNGLGAKTTQLYRGPLFLRGFDDDIRAHMAREMRKKGVDLRFDSDVRAIGEENGRLVAALADGGRIEADAIMYATGRRPLTRGIGLEEAGVVLNDDGTVPVDERFRSSAPSILALGDAVGRFELTPVAIAEGMAIAEMLFGDRAAAVDYANVPSAVFGQPPIGTVGLTEAQARDARGDDVEVYVSEFRPLKHTISLNGERTLMKIVAAPGGGPVLGVHMAGPDAGETIQGFAVALKAGATKAVFDSTLGVHPTGAEEFVTMREAVSAGAREAAQ